MTGRSAALASAGWFGLALVAVVIGAPRIHADDQKNAPAAQTPAAQTAPTPTAAATTETPSSSSSTSLEGIWMFDAKNSDDPMKVMQAARPNGGGGGEGGGRRRGGGGWGGGGGGGGGWGGGMGGGMGGRHGGYGRGGGGGGGGDNDADAPAQGSDSSGGRPRGPSPMARVMRPAKKVVIEMLTDEVKVSEDEMEARPYAISDSLKAHEHDLVTENTSAAWKGGRLIMTQALGNRGSLVEAYELSKDGKTLTISAHREGGPSGAPNVTLKRVYTRYEGD